MKQSEEIKLVININHKAPVKLVDLTVGLSGIASLYKGFTSGDKEAHLLVKEVRHGSIEIDLITSSSDSLVPLLTQVGNIIQFCDYIKLIGSYLRNKDTADIKSISEKHTLPQPTNNDFSNFSKSLKILNGNDDSISFTTKNTDNSVTYNGCTFYGEELSEMLESLPEVIENKEDFFHRKKLFKWVQTNFKTGFQPAFNRQSRGYFQYNHQAIKSNI